MPDELILPDVLDVAAASGSLPERAEAWLGVLEKVAPFDAAWLSVSMPGSGGTVVMASSGLDDRVRGILDRRATARALERLGLHRPGPPIATQDLRHLGLSGFRQMLATVLAETDGVQVGLAGLLYRQGGPPPELARARLAHVAPLVARGLSPARLVLASARLVPGAGVGILLLADGSTCPLPGLDGHALLHGDSPVVQVARECLRSGSVSRTFLWPASQDDREAGHVRITMVTAAGLPDVDGAALFLTDAGDCRGLTPRELQVLGMLVDGRSNQQISRGLDVMQRTVAAHVEHVMRKLQAASRTAAAVRAEREGLYVPPRSTRQVTRSVGTRPGRTRPPSP